MASDGSMTRAELIKNARENCARNLLNTKTSAHPLIHNNIFTPESPQEDSQNKVREFFVYFKIVIAVIIFISVVTIDKLNISINNINSERIAEAVYYNTSLGDISDFVKKINTDKIVEVFNNLD